MNAFSAAAAALAAAVLAGPAQAAPASPFDGVWRTDPASIAFSKRPDVMVLKDGVYDCRSCTPAYTVKADGAFHPVAGHPSYDETMLSVVDDRTVEQTERKDGRVVGTTRVRVSEDGRTAAVAWTDTTNAGAPPVSGTVIETRTAPAPEGAHAASGSWVATQAQDFSEAATLQTLKLQDGVLTLTTPTGQSYAAKVDGPPAPFVGDPSVTAVTVARAGPRELVETDLHDGEVVSVLHMTVSPDGRTLTLQGENKKTGAVSSAKAEKV